MIEVPTFLVVALVSGYLCFVLVPLVQKYCLEKGLFDMPGPRKIHKTPVPRLGGVAIYIAFFLGLIPGFLLLPELWHEYAKQIIGIFFGGSIIFAVGVYDDIKSLSPLTKLGWEIGACLVFAWKY
jgi:UDP-GlcNAc:undecaprenyl-phosphate GlcNAc-1-phosphate transferase